MLLREKRRDVCSHPRSLESAGPAQPPLHQPLSTRAPPSHHTPQTSTTALFPPARFSVLEQLTHGTSQVQNPPITALGHLGDCPPIPRQALTLSFWKEWRKLPPSSPSSLGVPGGLLMPLMLFGEFCGRWEGWW